VTGDALRPREYCELSKLSAGGRRRVSHKAHGTISWLHERLWDAMIEADPEPDEFEQTLWDYALEQGSANGPAKALASEIIADWRWASTSPVYTAWLRGLREKAGRGRHAGEGRRA
jgi:hypothetical protein